MKKNLHILLFCLVANGFQLSAQNSSAPAKPLSPYAPPMIRIKEAVRIKGMEKHYLVGYGIVVGLADTGDSDTELTQRTLSNLLENFNIKVDYSTIKAGNCAAVMVTATID
ncbi:MAG: hypothetical protein D6820_17970, partial [Lentisphaerae bacterium]